MATRLSKLVLFNWGVYSGKCVVDFGLEDVGVDRRAVCLSGETGSGKTTITDAYLALIRPKNADASYNAASNGGVGTHLERRTTKSYVRGDCGKDASRDDVEMRLRPDDVVNSAILGVFIDGTGKLVACGRLMQWFESEGTLKQVWVTSEAELDVERFNTAVATSELTPRLVSSVFPDASVYEGVGRYELAMGRLLGLGVDSSEIGNVTRLLSMVQGEKLPSNVGTLFKDYVLKSPDVRGAIRDCVETIRREDSRIHEMELTQRHVKVLSDMRDKWEMFESLSRSREGVGELMSGHDSRSSMMDGWRNQVSLAYAYLLQDKGKRVVGVASAAVGAAKAEAESLGVVKDRLQEQLLLSKSAAQLELESRIKVARSAHEKAIVEQRLAQASLDSVDTKIASETVRRDGLIRDAATISSDIDNRRTQLKALIDVSRGFAKFGDVNDATSWNHMVDAVAAYDMDEAARLVAERDELFADIREIRNQKIAKLKAEIADMEARRSRIPMRYAQARATLCSMMGLDEADLPFVGELFDMKQGEEEWRLAANSVYGGLAVRLLVDIDDRQRLQRAADRCKFGFKINYDGVDLDDMRDVRFAPDGMASKFEFDESSAFFMYVRRMLGNLDCTCVDDISTVKAERGKRFVSCTGQIASGNRGSFGVAKDRSDVIGFENKTRLEDLRCEVADYERDVVSMESRRKAVVAKLKMIGNRADAAKRLRAMSWSSFDVTALEDKISELERNRTGVEASLNDLADERAHAFQTVSVATEAVGSTEHAVNVLMQELNDLANRTDDELSRQVREATDAYKASVKVVGVREKELELANKHLDECQAVVRRRLERPVAGLPSGVASEVLVGYLLEAEAQYEEDEDKNFAKVFHDELDYTIRDVDAFTNGILNTFSAQLSRVEGDIAQVVELYGHLESRLVNFEDGYDWRYESVKGGAWSDVRSVHEELGLSELLDSDPESHVILSWRGYYESELSTLESEWGELDMGASLQAMCSNSLNSLASLQARDGAVRRDVGTRVRAVNKLLADIQLSDDDSHYLEVRSRIVHAGEAKVLFDMLRDFAQQNVDFAHEAQNMDLSTLRADIIDFVEKLDGQCSERSHCFLDPKDYVRITFTEHKGDQSITHSGTGKLSGGEMQQMSACIVGAALLYVMGADAGHGPAYETIVLDEAFVKSDEQHARNTLRVLMRMGFVPIVAMPPTIVMSVSPCLSKMLFVTKTEFGTSVVHENHSFA